MLTLQLDLKPHIEERIKYLLSKKSDKEVFFKDFLMYKIRELEKGIVKMKIDMRKYENQYKMSSEVFFEKFEKGEFGDEEDYMIWSGLCELYQKDTEELIRLKSKK